MTDPTQASRAQDLEVLLRLNRGYVHAAQTSDVRWYDEHLADDYMASNPDGSLCDKAGFLEAQIAFALKRPDMAPAVREFLKRYN